MLFAVHMTVLVDAPANMDARDFVKESLVLGSNEVMDVSGNLVSTKLEEISEFHQHIEVVDEHMNVVAGYSDYAGSKE